MSEKIRSAAAITLGGLIMIGVLFWLLDPGDEEADATVCRSNGGVYLYHKHECIQAQARAR